MKEDKKRVFLITGAAGFIGFFLAIRLLQNGEKVIGIDNLNDYYEVDLKESRLLEIIKTSQASKGEWEFIKTDIEDKSKLNEIFNKVNPTVVINLAAQAGVRYSLKNPESYIQSNLVGFANLLECCRTYKIENLIYASSSSVYGGNTKLPFEEIQNIDHPVSLYAATKKANELMAHSYSHLFKIPMTGLRFFTVYGPWGRPDMAPMIFAEKIMKGEPLSIFNFGEMSRDFTYIDDVVEALTRCCYKPATYDPSFDCLNPNPSTSFAPHRIFNVGNNNPVHLMKFIELLEENLGVKAKKVFESMQAGDVKSTLSDNTRLYDWIKFSPIVNIEEGTKKFTKWFLDYYSF